MLLTMLHGLFVNRKPYQNSDSYKTLITDVFTAPVGKSYGSYTIDGDGVLAFARTINLPNFVGSFLKKVQLDFLLERFATSQGDFIIATAAPVFPAALGNPIISEHYIKSLEGRKFISYLKDDNWTAWKELNCRSKYLANFTSFDASPLTVNIDPQTITEYCINIGLGSVITLIISNRDRIVKPLFVHLVPSCGTCSVIWPNGVIWPGRGDSPPLTLDADERMCVKFELSPDNLLMGSYNIYKVN